MSPIASLKVDDPLARVQIPTSAPHQRLQAAPRTSAAQGMDGEAMGRNPRLNPVMGLPDGCTSKLRSWAIGGMLGRGMHACIALGCFKAPAAIKEVHIIFRHMGLRWLSLYLGFASAYELTRGVQAHRTRPSPDYPRAQICCGRIRQTHHWIKP